MSEFRLISEPPANALKRHLTLLVVGAGGLALQALGLGMMTSTQVDVCAVTAGEQAKLATYDKGGTSLEADAAQTEAIKSTGLLECMQLHLSGKGPSKMATWLGTYITDPKSGNYELRQAVNALTTISLPLATGFFVEAAMDGFFFTKDDLNKFREKRQRDTGVS